MDTSLSREEVNAYNEQGYLTPVDVFSLEGVAELRSQFEAFEQRFGGIESATARRTDLHLIQKWAWDVVTDPRIVGRVTSLLGPDVLLWSTNWFIKEANDPKFVSMHQDANYWGLEPYEVLTAWVALSDASEATGPMSFWTGSHLGELYDHDNTYAENNLLSRGQEAKVTVPEDETVLAPLSAGQMSLHHVRLVHGSGANTTDDRRIGMVLRYCSTKVRQVKGEDTAVLVAGEDRYGHFELLPPPASDFGDSELDRQQDALKKMFTHIMSD